MLIAAIVVIAHVAGVVSAVHAIMDTRTAQGAIAWSVCLLVFPFLAVPAYWILGRRKFKGYKEAWLEQADSMAHVVERIRTRMEPGFVVSPERIPDYEALKGLAHWPLSKGNRIDLLVDGEATFDSILEGIEVAEHYVLVQFYIVRDDGLGRRLMDKLVEKAEAGVVVRFVYDEMGSKGLPSAYKNRLREAGGRMAAFNTTQGADNRFQLNFRNHRKIVVVDGKVAWVGGHNVGDEYLGLDPEIGPWRDTHVRIEGPAALGAQMPFLVDWYWATREVLELDGQPTESTADQHALLLSTGPADDLETAKLFFIHAINAARNRVWIATPYFTPDPAVMAALQLAALRGLDVRVITPKKNDSTLVQLSSYWFIQELDGLGIRFFQYREGFMHQKVMLVDDKLSCVGTHNFDSRSFVLNFEVTAVVHDEAFAGRLESMFEKDFERSDPLDPATLAKKPFWHRFAVRLARLSAPIQ